MNTLNNIFMANDRDVCGEKMWKLRTEIQEKEETK